MENGLSAQPARFAKSMHILSQSDLEVLTTKNIRLLTPIVSQRTTERTVLKYVAEYERSQICHAQFLAHSPEETTLAAQHWEEMLKQSHYLRGESWFQQIVAFAQLSTMCVALCEELQPWAPYSHQRSYEEVLACVNVAALAVIRMYSRGFTTTTISADDLLARANGEVVMGALIPWEPRKDASVHSAIQSSAAINMTDDAKRSETDDVKRGGTRAAHHSTGIGVLVNLVREIRESGACTDARMHQLAATLTEIARQYGDQCVGHVVLYLAEVQTAAELPASQSAPAPSGRLAAMSNRAENRGVPRLANAVRSASPRTRHKLAKTWALAGIASVALLFAIVLTVLNRTSGTKGPAPFAAAATGQNTVSAAGQSTVSPAGRQETFSPQLLTESQIAQLVQARFELLARLTRGEPVQSDDTGQLGPEIISHARVVADQLVVDHQEVHNPQVEILSAISTVTQPGESGHYLVSYQVTYELRSTDNEQSARTSNTRTVREHVAIELMRTGGQWVLVRAS